ncbi:Methylmalonyl-CoA carboxyltransferase 12S subunit [Culex quinquefasciatus]|uniref:Methylmalonyl-CoA carboxyltransferase 12S subunit n=1 Tax=Culex quinquefasciatus TaxID=7176 RepID=B0X7Z3_CULQU|nr:Methylmalonyl-CoA carboxyltransferase 12S subunit [Culex quinquefasciatus]|eukprot:XP_001865765.1 Methylmalonyl-CoA carboxyltransferase 12S subunit [Culex quinquefasciatus]
MKELAGIRLVRDFHQPGRAGWFLQIVMLAVLASGSSVTGKILNGGGPEVIKRHTSKGSFGWWIRVRRLWNWARWPHMEYTARIVTVVGLGAGRGLCDRGERCHGKGRKLPSDYASFQGHFQIGDRQSNMFRAACFQGNLEIHCRSAWQFRIA